MLPRALALIDDDPVYSECRAQHLQERGVQVTPCANGNSRLADPAADFDFHIVDLMRPGVDGEQLLDILRRRSERATRCWCPCRPARVWAMSSAPR